MGTSHFLQEYSFALTFVLSTSTLLINILIASLATHLFYLCAARKLFNLPVVNLCLYVAEQCRFVTDWYTDRNELVFAHFSCNHRYINSMVYAIPSHANFPFPFRSYVSFVSKHIPNSFPLFLGVFKPVPRRFAQNKSTTFCLIAHVVG